MRFPTLGIVTGVRHERAAAPLLRALADRCHIVAWHPGLPVDAVVATSWRAPRVLEATKAVDGALVLIESRDDPAPNEWRARARRTVEVPDPAVDTRRYRAVAPFLRERWRGRFGIEVPVEMPAALTWRQQRSFLALCPAVVALGTDALEALAFATPLVTDTATADRLGAVDGEHLVVADDHGDAVALATALGRDHRRGAALGHAGRLLVERCHDLHTVAVEIAETLEWPPTESRVTAHLFDLPTPPLARPITRAEARIAELSA